MGPKQVLPLRVRVDLGVMELKGHFIFPTSPAQQPPYQVQLMSYQRHLFFWKWGFYSSAKVVRIELIANVIFNKLSEKWIKRNQMI